MPAMLLAGMLYRGHGTGRPRHSYETPETVACRVDDAFFIHHRSWWMVKRHPPYEVAGLANKHRIYKRVSKRHHGPYHIRSSGTW